MKLSFLPFWNENFKIKYRQKMLLHVIYKFKINTHTNTHILSYTNKIQSPVPGYVRMSPCQSVPLLRVLVLVLVHFTYTV